MLPSSGSSAVPSRPFGTVDGETVQLYTLRNASGAEATITNYGGTVVSLHMPDREGRLVDVVAGFDRAEAYVRSSPFFGALIGRYGNRIARGRFTLDGRTYALAVNHPPNALHGGAKGFDKVIWRARPVDGKNGAGLELTYLSRDGEEGYPGNLNVTALYTLAARNELRLEFTATTDQATVVNLTNHSYFNLDGDGDILDHLVTINADRFTPVDQTLIPTGELRPVEGTPFDFRQPAVIGARIKADDAQIRIAGGFDHNWVVNQNKPGEFGLQARMVSPRSGIVLEVLSTEPGVQFYTGNFLDGTAVGKNGRAYPCRAACCFESQHFPDSPNQPAFPSTVLRPGQTLRGTIVYRFSTAP